jgi:hypothetical protein
MGKSKRRVGYEMPIFGVMMKEKKDRSLSNEWYEKRKSEKKMQRRLRKIKNR